MNGYEAKPLSSFSLQDKTDHLASYYVMSIKYAFSLFWKSLSNVIEPIADNCVTFRTIPGIANVYFIDCCGQHYNLAVKNNIMEKMNILLKVENKTTSINFHVCGATFTVIKPLTFSKCANSKRSTMVTILERYNALRKHIYIYIWSLASLEKRGSKSW